MEPDTPGQSGAEGPRLQWADRIGWLLVLVLALVWCVGLFPLVPVEGDEQGILFGAWVRAGGHAQYQPLSYMPEIQPGTHVLLAAVGRIDSFWIEPAYGLMSAAGALGFVLLGALLVRRVVGLPWWLSLLLMLQMQEAQAAACYMNSSSLAGALALAAVTLPLVSRLRHDWLAVGALLAVGGWLRMDSLLVSPAVLCAYLHRDGRVGEAVLRTALAAVVSLAGVAGLAQAAGHPLTEVLAAYCAQPETGEGLRSWAEGLLLLTSPAMLAASVAGAALCPAPMRLWFLFGILPSVLAYRHSLATTKYLYYILPFVAIYAGACVSRIRIRLAGTAAFGALAVLTVALDGMVGLRTSDDSLRVFSKGETLAKATIGRHKGRELALVVGPGELCRHADGFRVRTGQAFAPLRWRAEKEAMQENLSLLGGFVDANEHCRLLWGNWLCIQAAQRVLLDKGYEAVLARPPTEGPVVWRRGARTVVVDYHPYANSPFFQDGRRYGPYSDRPTWFIGDLADVAPIAGTDAGHRWRLVSRTAKGFINLFACERVH